MVPEQNKNASFNRLPPLYPSEEKGGSNMEQIIFDALNRLVGSPDLTVLICQYFCFERKCQQLKCQEKIRTIRNIPRFVPVYCLEHRHFSQMKDVETGQTSRKRIKWV